MARSTPGSEGNGAWRDGTVKKHHHVEGCSVPGGARVQSRSGRAPERRRRCRCPVVSSALPVVGPLIFLIFCSCRCRLLPTTTAKCCRLGAYHGPLPNSGAVAIYLDSCLRHATWEANIGIAMSVFRLGYFWPSAGQSCLFQWKHPILLTTPWARGSDLFVVVGCNGDMIMMPNTSDIQVENQDVAPLPPKARFKTNFSSYVIDAPCLYDGTNYTTHKVQPLSPLHPLRHIQKIMDIFRFTHPPCILDQNNALLRKAEPPISQRLPPCNARSKCRAAAPVFPPQLYDTPPKMASLINHFPTGSPPSFRCSG